MAEAHRYAQRGWRVIPETPGEKHPPVTSWQNAATTDPGTIDAWWGPGGQYENHGVGIATGEGSDVFVVDIDNHDIWETDFGSEFPETATVETGSGGVHLYFKIPPGARITNANTFPDGIDVRGNGGQVLAPPTLHPDTGEPYKWTTDCEPADAPQWVLDHAVRHEPEPVPPPPRPVRVDAGGQRPGEAWADQNDWAEILQPDGWTLHHRSHDGERHWTRPGKATSQGTSATTGYAGAGGLKVFTSSLTSWGLHPDESYSKLGYLTATKFDGDYPAAAAWLRSEGFGDTRTANDVVFIGEASANQPTPPHPPAGIDPETGEVVPADPTPDPLAALNLFDFKTFHEADDEEDRFLIAGVVAKAGGHVWFAKGGDGKSELALNVSCCAASGIDLTAGNQNSDRIKVLYLDYEMTAADMKERIGEFGFNPEDLDGYLFYASLPDLDPLNTATGAMQLLQAVNRLGVSLVVLDTTIRANDGDENDSGTIRDFNRHVGKPLKQAGVALLRIDHAGKDGAKGQRGSSAKNDDVDVVMRLEQIEGGTKLTATKNRWSSWYPQEIAFTRDVSEGVTYRMKAKPTSWPAGTKDAADLLDHLDIPVDTSRRKATDMIRESGRTAPRANVLQAAVNYRKDPTYRVETGREPLGNHS